MSKNIIFSMILLIALLLLSSCSTRGTSSRQSSGNLQAADNSLAYQEVPSNAEYVLTLSHDHNTEGYNHLAAMVLKTAIENKSNGRIGIKIYPNGQLAGGGREEANALINGTIDIAKITGDLSAFWAPYGAFEIPYIFPDDRIAEALFSDIDLVEKARKDIFAVQPNLRLMAIASSGGWKSFATTKKQIKTPADVRNLKIRTVPSKVQQGLVTTFGGAPTAMPYAEIYTSLSTGVVDGVKLSMVDIVTAKLHESLRYYVIDNHSYLVGFWFINNNSFEKLPGDLKVVVADSFEDLRGWLASYPKYASIAAYNAFRAQGGEIYTPSAAEVEEFVKASQPVRDALISESSSDVGEWVQYIDRKVAEYERSVGQKRKNETQ